MLLGGFGRLSMYPALAAGLAVTLPFMAAAKDRPTVLAQADTGKLDALKQRDQELKAVRDKQRKSAETEAALRREIEQIGADRSKLNQDLIDTAGRLRAVEFKIATKQERLKPLDANEHRIRISLAGCRAVIGE